MDDLLDLSFTSEPASQPATATGTPQLPVYKSSTGVSSQSALSAPTAASPPVSRSSTRNDTAVPPKKPGDSFASLVSFSTAKKQAAANRSLNEQLKTRSQTESPTVNTNADDWASGLSFDVLDSSAKPGSQPSAASVPPPATINTSVNLLDDEDILGPLAQAITSASETSTPAIPASPPGSTATPEILSERSKTPLPQNAIGDSRDLPVAELVDMGFSVDQARRALAMTDNGLNVQQAVDILVNESHEKAKQRHQRQHNPRQAQRMSRNETEIDDDVLAPHPDDRRRPARRFSQDPEMMKYEDEGEWQDMPSIYSNGTTSDRSGGSLGFKMSQLSGQNTAHDIGKIASGLSAQLRSRAEGLWKQGRERVARAVEEYNNAGGLSAMVSEENPRWMRNQHRYRYDQDAQEVNLESPIPEDRTHESHGIAATLEAMLLEQEGPYKQKSPSPLTTPVRPISSSLGSTAAMPRPTSLNQEKSRAPQPPSADIPPMPRRPPRPPVPSASTSRSSAGPTTASAAPKRSSRPARPRVDISPTQIEQIGVLRTDGMEAFKRGDFTHANELYSKSLDLTPSIHLLRTVLLSNRAACLLKLGNVKDALADAEEGLNIIGPTRGIDEEYERGKSLVEIWAKLLQRKSEALEQLERFKDARDAWDVLVQAGRGGKVAIDGKRRCENILNPKPKSAASSTATSARSTPRPTKSTSIEDSVAAQAALKRLQKMNDEAEAQDAEKFALHDTVEQKLAAWRSGKEDNLRALIGSLDTILWAETGWAKVSMADLVMPKKVKINYMKAVAKTHPDKIPGSATTEQKMIAQGVFVSLNRAWDEFKRLNNIQ
ncbi:hypothetical protein V1525DRAFT_447615 [Lipomyces kononenkoae]|uniref:Uncharacterized protein n=1 Tax=Lipomyces kononenkoae TaxID=34357 RepID=A0ACC3TBR8_LIPKO